MDASQSKRRVTRIRHAHDAPKIAGLREQMLADGSVCLQVEKVFTDLSRLKDFTFLQELSIRQLKRGISAVGNLNELVKLSLWDIQKLTFSFVENLPSLKHLECYGVKFADFALPKAPSVLQSISLRVCNGFGDEIDLSNSESLQRLYIEDCGHLSRLSDCSHLSHLSHVTISNVRDLRSLSGIAAAPNLRAIVVQLAPNLPIMELEWMLTHPTLENVYPLLEANAKSPLMAGVRELLAPKFGDDIFERRFD